MGEEPVLFREEEGGSQAYLFLHDGEVRDQEGKILSDKTVVEFYYNDNAEVDPKFRWIPMRTRYDKTESVMKYRKNYGNYFTVANRVWRSIVNPILISDLADLGTAHLLVTASSCSSSRISPWLPRISPCLRPIPAKR
jgi:hypothetical protein